MRRPSRAALGSLCGALMIVGGCTVLSGASDLRTEPAPSSDGGSGGASSGSPSGSKDDGGGSSGEGGTSTVDASSDATSTGRIREVTFESGSLTGPNGGDTFTGAPGSATVASDKPLRGKLSMRVGGSSSFVDTTFPKADDIYVSFAFLVTAFPNPNDDAVIARFGFAASTTTLDITVAASGLSVNLGGASAGIGSVQLGTAYRVGLHITTSSQLKVSAFFVQGATGVFPPKGGGLAIGTLGAVTHIALGAVTAVPITVELDHLLVDSLAMPDP